MLRVEWTTLKSQLSDTDMDLFYIEEDTRYILRGFSNEWQLECILDKTPSDTADLDDFEANYKSTANQSPLAHVEVSSSPAFQAKTVGDKKLFQRVEGAEFAVTISGNPNILNFTIPYVSCKFTGLEILGGESGDKVKLNILDTDTGTVSTVPNYVLNTFGGKHGLVNISPDFYVRESRYDADLFIGLKISVEYTSISDKTVYINYVLHELKD